MTVNNWQNSFRGRCFSAAIICVSGDGRYHESWRRAAKPVHSSRTKPKAANMPTPESQEFFARIQGGD
jgi:hypothetical protein